MAAVQERLHTPRAESPVRSPKHVERHDTRPARQVDSQGAKWLNRMSLSACCILSFVAVWMVATKGADVYRLNGANMQMQNQISQQSALNATLSTKVAQLEQPSRILNVAINHLHMQYKTPLVIPSLKTGQ